MKHRDGARPHPLKWNALFGTARDFSFETCQEKASYSVDGSKLKTSHLVRGVHVCKDKNYAVYDFVLMYGVGATLL